MSETIKEVIDWQTIVASPGYTLWFIDDDGDLFAPTPIIGWLIERYRAHDNVSFFWTHFPITPEDIGMPTQDYAVQYPDGRVCIVEDTTLENLAEAREYLKKKPRYVKRG